MIAPTVTRTDGALIARADFALRYQLKAIPGGRWSAALRAWVFPESPYTARALANLVGERALDGAAAALLTETPSASAVSTAAVTGDLEPLPFDTPTKPWAHQLGMVRFAEPLRAALWNVGMGAGKTRAAFDLIRLRGHSRVLVAAPLAVVPAWASQAALHAPTVRVVALSNGSTQKRASQAAAAWKSATPESPVVVVGNYECVSALPFIAASAKAGLDLIVADEAHRLKSPAGSQSRAVSKLSAMIPNRLALSGTPMPHSPMDAFGVFRFLDPGVFGSSFVSFRARYAILGGFQGRQVIGYQNMDDFARRIAPLTYEVSRDVLDLPEVTHAERTFALPAEAKRFYDDLKSELIAYVGDTERVTAANSLARLLRLAQIASGHVGIDLAVPAVDDGGEIQQVAREVREIHREKERLLREVLDEIADDEPVVVFARFRHDLAQIRRAAEEVGARCAELSGDRNELSEWQRPDGPRVLAVQIQSGSEGIDLTRARYCVFYSIDYSLGRYSQALARVHRPGQTRPVTYVHLIAEGTVDRHVRRAIAARGNVIDDVLAMVREASCL